VKNLPALDPNHTHFILVDDGTQPTMHGKINLRSELVKHVSHMNTNGDKGRSLVMITMPYFCYL